LWAKHSSKILGANIKHKGSKMATVIRLTRMGRKKQPFYRIAVTDSRKRRDGGWIELIGYYNPMTEPSTVKVDEERLAYWMSVGAQLSDRVKKITGK
jgi:small subunit ribosomal protein S16